MLRLWHPKGITIPQYDFLGEKTEDAKLTMN